MKTLFSIPALVAGLTIFSCCSASLSTTQFLAKSIESKGLKLVLTVYFESPLPPSGTPSLEFDLKNGGDTSLFFLPWGTPWEDGVTRELLRISQAGARVPYQGPVVKRRAPEQTDYVEIPANSSIRSTLDLSDYYSLTGTAELGITYSQGSLSFLVEEQSVWLDIEDLVLIKSVPE